MNGNQDNPSMVSNAERVAHMFMMEGRSNAPTGDYSDSFELPECDPQIVKMVGQFDLTGCTKSGSTGEYDYDMKPMRLNPGSSSGQDEPKMDAEGFPMKMNPIGSHLKKA